jgi:hypothetical protein
MLMFDAGSHADPMLTLMLDADFDADADAMLMLMSMRMLIVTESLVIKRRKDLTDMQPAQLHLRGSFPSRHQAFLSRSR